MNTNIAYRERQRVNQRTHMVDIHDRNNMFIPAWKALYLEKQGKLARVGFFQHIEIDEPTVWSRARAAKEAEEKSE